MKTRKQTLLDGLKLAVILLPIAAIGGYFTGRYAFASYSEEMQQILLAQVGSVDNLAIVSLVQSVMYMFICTMIGTVFAEATGLKKELKIEADKLVKSALAAIACGVFFTMDYWGFGKLIPQVKASYESGLLIRSLDNWLASIFYGGFIEEVLLRLFLMSLVTFIIWKLFFRKYNKEEIPVKVVVIANVICALIFAAGHLPATIASFGSLTGAILVRCFLLNGCFGIVFGELYRRYGIQYAFVGHMGTHMVSKLIWLLFVPC